MRPDDGLCIPFNTWEGDIASLQFSRQDRKYALMHPDLSLTNIQDTTIIPNGPSSLMAHHVNSSLEYNTRLTTHLLLGDVELSQLLQGDIYPVALPDVFSDVS